MRNFEALDKLQNLRATVFEALLVAQDGEALAWEASRIAVEVGQLRDVVLGGVREHSVWRILAVATSSLG